jgi:hypothetical protein
MRVNYVRHRFAGSDAFNDGLHGNPRARNHGLTKHHVRINNDVVFVFHGEFLNRVAAIERDKIRPKTT